MPSLQSLVLQHSSYTGLPQVVASVTSSVHALKPPGTISTHSVPWQSALVSQSPELLWPPPVPWPPAPFPLPALAPVPPAPLPPCEPLPLPVKPSSDVTNSLQLAAK